MRRLGVLAAVTLLGSAGLAGCTTGTDDELQARPTPTVTVTGEPLTELPARLDLASDVDLSDAVVWADGSVVHVDDRAVDVAPLRPTRLLVLDEGVLALADGQVWFLAGRRAEGLPLPSATSMDLSADGGQIVLRVADRDEPVAWTTQGVRVPDDAVARVRTDERTDAGPGVVEVVRSDATGGPTVTGAGGEAVDVPGLPDRFRVAGWTGPYAFYGPTAGGEVVSCTVQAAPGCTTLGSAEGGAGTLVFGDHPAG